MEITIAKACIYKDGRCHSVYTDGSGIILHSGGHYTTYFSPTGEIQRHLTLCTVSGIKSKLLKLLKLVNTSLPSPISVFSEEIYKVSTHEAKISSCTFESPSTIQVISGDQVLNSISLNPSNESFIIVHQDEKQNLKIQSIEKNVSVSLNAARNLLKVSFPFLLPHRKPNWTENLASRVRLSYEYANLTQIFHVSQVPDTWRRVLGILMIAAGSEGNFVGSEQDLGLNDGLRGFGFDDDEEVNREFVVMLPTSAHGQVWNSDTVSPAASFYNFLEDNVYWVWKPEGTFYVPESKSILVLIHEDQSLLLSSGDYLTHIRQDNTIKFTFDSIPPSVRANSSSPASYKLHSFVAEIRELYSLPSKPHSSESQACPDYEYSDGVKHENEVEGVGSFIAYNDRSIRVLFEDRTCIRIYSDFTVSAISRSGESARFTLENPFGFESYIPVCVEFYNWAFLSQTDQGKRIQETAEREAIVNAELSKFERISNQTPQTLTSHYANSSNTGQTEYLNHTANHDLPDEITSSLIAAEKQMQETRELLNKLNNYKA